MDGRTATVLADLTPETAATVQHLVRILDGAGLDRAIKWQKLTFAEAGDFHHWICAISTTKRGVALNFHFGGLLEDPDGRLIAGTSKFFRKLEFSTVADIDDAIVLAFVRQALDRLAYFKANWQAIQAGAVV